MFSAWLGCLSHILSHGEGDYYLFLSGVGAKPNSGKQALSETVLVSGCVASSKESLRGAGWGMYNRLCRSAFLFQK